MARNNRFIDAAVGYRPQTAFPLNANEYFESLHAAKQAAAMAAEVGTEEAGSTSYYIGQTLVVYEQRVPVVNRPVTNASEFRSVTLDAVDRSIPVVLITLDGSVDNPGEDSGSQNLAACLDSETWTNYVNGNVDRFCFVYGQKGVDENLWDAVSRPTSGIDPLFRWYREQDWTDSDAMPFAKVGVVYEDEDGVHRKMSVDPADWDSAEDLISFINEEIGSVGRTPSASLYQIQPDRTLRAVGFGAAADVEVDEVTIGKMGDGTIYLKSIPQEMLENAGMLFKDWTIGQT